MLTIQIRDEQIAQQLQQIAERENRPVEEVVINALIAQYPTKPSTPQADKSEAVKRVRRNAYTKARQYWESVGDTAKASMTDELLDTEFAVFDEQGIPRLKSEMSSLEPPVGSLAYAAKIVRETGGIRAGQSLDATKADDILNEEFADYLFKRMWGEDASE